MKHDVTMVLQKKAEQVRHNAEILFAETNDWQVIQKYLCNKLKDIELTATQQKKLDRYQFIYNQLVSGNYTDNEVLQQVTKMYDVNIRQAYQDMNNSREIFSAVINVNKKFELQQQLQINRDMMRKAIALSDVDGYAKLEKNRSELLKQLPDEPDNPAEMFEGHTIHVMFDPALIGAPPVDMKEVLAVLNAKRNKKIKIDMFEELKYEEVNDNPAAL